MNPLTRDEARAFLGVVRHSITPAITPFFLVRPEIPACRLGELLALQWGDIDFHGGFIEVRRAYVMGEFTTPKNGKTRRIDLVGNLPKPSSG